MDNQIGKFISIDPILIRIDSIDKVLSDPQSLNTYVYSRNNPVILVDRDGNTWKIVEFLAGFGNAYASDNALGVGRANSNSESYSSGQRYGDAAATVQGFVEMTVGALIAVSGTTGAVVTAPTGVGAIAGTGVTMEGVAVAGHGAGVTGVALRNMMKSNDSSLNKNIDWGKQDKHIPGTNNYRPGKSILTHDDPQSLIDRFSGKGQPIYNKNVLQREVVDFGENIGKYVDPVTKKVYDTNIGTIHYSEQGVHIVPERPNYFNH